LANCIEHALVLCDGLPLTIEYLPARLGATKPRPLPVAAAPIVATEAPGGEAVSASSAQAATTAPAFLAAMAAAPGGPTPLAGPTPAARESKPVSLREMEMQAIVEALERNQGNKPRTAEELGISLKTLYNKLHQLADAQQAAGQTPTAVGGPTDAAA
jgi:DNA-binding NtrC family response regulator